MKIAIMSLLLSASVQAATQSEYMKTIELHTLAVCSDAHCEGDYNFEQVRAFYQAKTDSIKVYTAWSGPDKKPVYRVVIVPSRDQSPDDIAMSVLDATCPDMNKY